MGSPVTHFEVHGKDGDTLNKFYAELFDWHVDSDNPMNYGMVDTHGGDRGINGGIAQDDQGAFVTFYVEVDDLQAALDKAEQLGVSLEAAARVQEVAAEDVPPTSYAVPRSNVLRPDQPRPSLPREEALAGAPEVEADRFKVPRVVEME